MGNLDGKKTWLGLILAAAPQLVDLVATVLQNGEVDPSKFVAIAGTVLVIVGAGHKLYKDVKGQ